MVNAVTSAQVRAPMRTRNADRVARSAPQRSAPGGRQAITHRAATAQNGAVGYGAT